MSVCVFVCVCLCMYVVCFCACTTGTSVCIKCVPGKYSAATGQTSSATCTICEAGKYKAAAPLPPPTPPVVVVYDFTPRNSIGDYQSYCSQIGATCVLTNYWVGGVSHSDYALPNVRTSISLPLLATHNRLVVDYYAIANRDDVSISIDDVVM